MISLILCFATGAAALGAIPKQAQTAPLKLHAGPHLFLDDFLIESSSNVVRRVNSPKRALPGPVVTGKEDHNFQPYVTVLRDGGAGTFRMWYNVAINGGQSHLGYLESPDGVQWLRPHQVLADPSRIIFGASVLDEGSAFPDPARRYKFAWYNNGMMLARSADGLQWTADPAQPVLTGINDILHLAWDPARKRYVAVFGYPSRPDDGYRGKPHHAAEGYRRCVGQSTSGDCLHWSAPRRIIKPDKLDDGITEFYSIGGVIARGELLIGFLKVLRDDLPCDPGGPIEGIGYTVLAWSHDGENWERDREPFFDRSHEAGAWDHAMAWMDYQLPVKDEVFCYYGGYARGHKVERFTERQLGMVRMKRDRYVAREAEPAGTLRTRLVIVEGDAISLNVNAASGEVRAQLLDEQGRAIRGYQFRDCEAVRSDEAAALLRWQRPLSELRGKPVRLEFFLRQAKLFGIEVGDGRRINQRPTD